MTQAAFSLGGARHQRVEVPVVGYERPATGEYHDDNWLSVEVSLVAGGFTGRFRAAFVTDELVDFRAELARLYETLNGEARRVTLEQQLSLLLRANGRGGSRWKATRTTEWG